MNFLWLGQELEGVLRAIFGDWLTTPAPQRVRRRHQR